MSRYFLRIITSFNNYNGRYIFSNKNNFNRTVYKDLHFCKFVNTPQFLRLYSQNFGKATFQDVKDAKNNPNVVVIDVREPSELKETGVIPGSVNIPLGEVEDAFKTLKDEEFRTKYGLSKPNTDTAIIFSCKLGKRSQTALEILKKMSYNNVRNYEGGWLEWEQKISKN